MHREPLPLLQKGHRQLSILCARAIRLCGRAGRSWGFPRQGRWGSPSADVGRGAARIPHPDPAGAGTSFIFLRSSLFGGGDPLLFIYFLRAIFWPLPGLLCSKSPLFQNFLSFIRITARLCTGAPPGEPASRWQFLSDTQLPPDVSAPRPAPLGARFFSFVTLIAD